jgi:hypothetical protein
VYNECFVFPKNYSCVRLCKRSRLVRFAYWKRSFDTPSLYEGLSLNSETAAVIFNLVKQGYSVLHTKRTDVLQQRNNGESYIFWSIKMNVHITFKGGLLDKKNSGGYSTDKSPNRNPYRFICERETWHGCFTEQHQKQQKRLCELDLMLNIVLVNLDFTGLVCIYLVGSTTCMGLQSHFSQFRYYGVGLYLSRWFDYSHGFAKPDKHSNRCMILCRVKVGDVHFSNPHSDDDFLENGKQYDTRIAYAESKSLWPKDPDNIVIPPRNFDCVLPYALIYYE